MLERAAAAMRPAGPPPLDMPASSSSSSHSDCLASRRSHLLHTRHGGSVASRVRASHVPSVAQPAAAADSALAAAAADSALAAAAVTNAAAAAVSLSPSAQHAIAPLAQPVRGSSLTSSARMQRQQQQQQRQQQQQQRAVPTQPAQFSLKGGQLMWFIRWHCSSPEKLAAVLEQCAPAFTAQHFAAALYQLASLWVQHGQQQHQLPQGAQPFSHAVRLQQQLSQMQQLGSTLLRGFMARMAEAQLRDMADVLYALDTLGLRPQGAAADTAGGGVGAASPGPIPGASASSMGSAAAAAAGIPAGFCAACLQHSNALLQRDLRQQQLPSLRPFSRLLTSFAHLGVRPGLDWWAAALDAAAGYMEVLLQQGHTASSTGSSSHSSSAGSALQESAQALALMGWAVAKLQAPASQSWWGLYHTCTAQLMPAMTPSQLCSCLYACALARQAPDAAWMAAFYTTSSSLWPAVSSQGHAVMLWSLVQLQQQPPGGWLQQLDAASAGTLHSCSLQHLSMVLWAHARLLGRPAALMRPDAAAQTQQVQQHHVAQQQLWMLHPQQQQWQQQQHGMTQSELQAAAFPSAAWQEQAWVQLSRFDPAEESPRGVAGLMCGLVQLHLQLPSTRLQELEGLCLEALRSCDARSLAVLMWGLGRLRGPDTSRRLVKAFRRRCSTDPQLLQQMAPQALWMLLLGLAQMDAWQPDSLKEQLRSAVVARVSRPQQQDSQQRRRQQFSSSRQQQQQQAAPAAVAACDGSAAAGEQLSPEALPYVLRYCRQLRISLPADTLRSVELQLQQRVVGLPAKALCFSLVALATAKHSAEPAFVCAVLKRVDRELSATGPQDVTQLLFGLAIMTSWDSGLRGVLQERRQQAWLVRLVQHTQQSLPSLNGRELATVVWSLGHLQLQPPEPFLQGAMAATLRLLPGLSLLSTISILSGFRALQYLPPLPWMQEVCAAARSKLSTDSTPKPWQRRACLRRFEDVVSWYNQTVQQQAGVKSYDSYDEDSSGAGVESEEQEQAHRRLRAQRARMGLLASAGNPGSEGLLAAAVGVAAAVAQQWHP